MIYRAALAFFFVSACSDAELDSTNLPSGTDDAAIDTGAPDTGSPEGDLLARVTGLGPARVKLGRRTNHAAAGSYTLLASAAITNVTGSAIGRGHVGLSPAAASYITGFALVADASNQFATSPAVTSPGKVYAANFAAPTPSNLTRAVGSMGRAYTDAAGRSNPDYLNLQGGDIGGLTLAPGLYTWVSTVTIPTNVTIAGGANDVWIFQIANDLDISAAKRVVLSGGARSGNIFWQVAGEVVIHEDAHFEGIILSQTGVTLQTNASLNGRIFAKTQIALDDNRVSGP